MELRRLIPWGSLGRIVNLMLWDLVKAIRKDPNVLGAILARYITATDIMHIGGDDAPTGIEEEHS